MTKYRGYYIDGFHFISKADIDSFIRNQMIDSYKKAFGLWLNDMANMARSSYCCDLSDRMMENGFTTVEIEAIEESCYC